MRTVLITLIGPQRTADLVVDADTPVGELLPNLLTAGGVAQDADQQEGNAARQCVERLRPQGAAARARRV